MLSLTPIIHNAMKQQVLRLLIWFYHVRLQHGTYRCLWSVRSYRLERLRDFMDVASEEMAKKQAKYKEQYDRKLQKRRLPQLGESVLIKKEQRTQKEEGWHKIADKTEGPFPVVEVSPDATHVTIDRGQYQETISRDRIELAPKPDFGGDALEPNRGEIRSKHRRDAAEYVLLDIVGHSIKEDNPKAWEKVNCLWYGFKKPTWNPIQNVTRNQVLRYCCRYELPAPENLFDAIKGHAAPPATEED